MTPRQRGADRHGGPKPERTLKEALPNGADTADINGINAQWIECLDGHSTFQDGSQAITPRQRRRLPRNRRKASAIIESILVTQFTGNAAFGEGHPFAIDGRMD